MSGVSLAVAPRSEPDETSPTTANQKTQHHRQQQQTTVGGIMGSLRVIELQLVAFIMVFSASGLVPLFDLAFPVFTTVYLLILSRLAFLGHGIPYSAESELIMNYTKKELSAFITSVLSLEAVLVMSKTYYCILFEPSKFMVVRSAINVLASALSAEKNFASKSLRKSLAF
ncbi:hypothetical protein Tco_0591142 [Tanacetum coccineum]